MSSTPSQTAQERAARLEARIGPSQKALFKQAAAHHDRSLSDFIVQAASEAATRVVQAQQVITLTTQEQKVFVEALLNPHGAKGEELRAGDRGHGMQKNLGNMI